MAVELIFTGGMVGQERWCRTGKGWRWVYSGLRVYSGVVMGHADMEKNSLISILL